MKLVGRVPVEQLDTERLVNIERRIVANARIGAEPRSPRRLLAFAAVAMAAGVAGLVGWQLHRPQLAAAIAADKIAMHGSTMQLGDAAITGNGAQFEVTRTGRDILVELAHGQVELAVAHDASRVFVVRAGDTEIEDVGTKFSVDYDGARVVVRVTEGEVKVKRQQQELRIAAGNEWTTGGTPRVVAIATTPSVIEMDAMDTHTAPQKPRPHEVTTPDPETMASKHVGSAAKHDERPAVTPKHDEPRGAGGDLIAAIKSAPVAPAEPITGEFAKAVLDAKDVASKSQVFYAWALATNDLTKLEPVLRKSAGVAYVPALWLKVRITCLHALDERCRTSAHDYEAAGGPNAEIAHRILVETQ